MPPFSILTTTGTTAGFPNISVSEPPAVKRLSSSLATSALGTAILNFIVVSSVTIVTIVLLASKATRVSETT